MSSASLIGFEYYIIFIYDYSRNTWIYFLRSKKSKEVFKRFQDFKAFMENQAGRRILVLKSDNGGEYTSKQFYEYCRQEGIQRQLRVPYTPQQNGVAERKNHAIVGATRAMLHDQSLPFFLWDEAYNTIVYVQNRITHHALGCKTPEEMFTEKNPEIGHFCICGCLTYSHVPSEKRIKLEAIVDKCIFMMRLQRHFAYTVLYRGKL